MRRLLITILAFSVFFCACKKEHITEPESCLPQTDNPDHRSYPVTEVSYHNYAKKHCGLMPLSSKHSWVYIDSLFIDGDFSQAKYDTLRFEKSFLTQPDGLIWWEPNKFIGLPEKTYANDSALFALEDRLFTSHTILDAKKILYLHSIDSIRFLTSFGDEAAFGTQKMNSSMSTPAGNFSGCIYLEKFAPGSRKDQLYLKPGVGVVKFIHQEASTVDYIVKPQLISTLVAFTID